MRQLASEVGLTVRAAERSLDEVLTATEDAAQAIRAGSLPLHPRAQRDLARVIDRRRRDLSG